MTVPSKENLELKLPHVKEMKALGGSLVSSLTSGIKKICGGLWSALSSPFKSFKNDPAAKISSWKKGGLAQKFTAFAGGAGATMALKATAVGAATYAGSGIVGIGLTGGLAVTGYGAYRDYRAAIADGTHQAGFRAFINKDDNSKKYSKKLLTNSGLAMLGGFGASTLSDYFTADTAGDIITPAPMVVPLQEAIDADPQKIVTPVVSAAEPLEQMEIPTVNEMLNIPTIEELAARESVLSAEICGEDKVIDWGADITDISNITCVDAEPLLGPVEGEELVEGAITEKMELVEETPVEPVPVVEPAPEPLTNAQAADQAKELLASIDLSGLSEEDARGLKRGAPWAIQNVAHYMSNGLEGFDANPAMSKEFAQIVVDMDVAHSAQAEKFIDQLDTIWGEPIPTEWTPPQPEAEVEAEIDVTSADVVANDNPTPEAIVSNDPVIVPEGMPEVVNACRVEEIAGVDGAFSPYCNTPSFVGNVEPMQNIFIEAASPDGVPTIIQNPNNFAVSSEYLIAQALRNQSLAL